jgi:hypothetical protein
VGVGVNEAERWFAGKYVSHGGFGLGWGVVLFGPLTRCFFLGSYLLWVNREIRVT